MLIAVTTGEPAGIGPDIVLSLANQSLPACPVVIGDRTLLCARAEQLGLNIQFSDIEEKIFTSHKPGQLQVKHYPLAKPSIPGKPDPANAQYVLDTIEHAVGACINNQYAALVTAPVQKSTINEARLPFTGHTEFLGELTNAQPVMMLANETFRVALVTTHVPLNKVSENITNETLTDTITILHNDLKNLYGIPQPRILIAGLNPHAGENGYLGDQEQKVIIPVIKKLVEQGMQLTGPLPADTLFTAKYLDQCDAVLAMYHDQGLPVLKYASFGQAVNITLGLPIIRTSVDHGTALELAGTGHANTSSLMTAFQLAHKLALNKEQH